MANENTILRQGIRVLTPFAGQLEAIMEAGNSYLLQTLYTYPSRSTCWIPMTNLSTLSKTKSAWQL